MTAICSMFMAVAIAQDITRQELQAFDRFLDSHPAIERDLQNKATLINDPAYLSAHPELRDFLATHPRVREDFQQNPRRFVNRERAFDKSGKDITRNEVRDFDNFLDRHPAIERDLEKNPSLANNADYLARHPELNNFLTSHPRIREDVRQNPRVFMRQERKFDKQERKIERRQEHRAEKRAVKLSRTAGHFR
jgi:hypothetical protein